MNRRALLFLAILVALICSFVTSCNNEPQITEPQNKMTWRGDFASAPSNPAKYDVYFNETDGCSYLFDGTQWTLLARQGASGEKGDKGDAGLDGQSIDWKGSYANAPANPSELCAYFNTSDGCSYIYKNGSWSLLAGCGTSISWLGSFASAPNNPVLYAAYYNTTDGCSYIYDGTQWTLLAKQGAQGETGAQGEKGDKGDTGAQGAAGLDGKSIVWKGSYESAPANPSELWAYYNTSDGCSYIFDGTQWTLLAKQGAQGVQGETGASGSDGKSIVWKGSLSSAPASPEELWAYYNTTDGCSYIYDGTQWTLLAKQGSQGETGAQGVQGEKGDKGDTGAQGAAGLDGKSIIWKGTSYTAPADPVELWAYYNATDGNAYIYSNGAWNLLMENLSVNYDSPTIIGTVVSGSSYEAKDVYVKVVDETTQNTVWNSQVAADGDFAISDLDETKTYSLYFTTTKLSDVNLNAKGLTLQEPTTYGLLRQNVKPSAGTAHNVGDITLTPNGKVCGKIVNSNSEAISEADVFLEGTSYMSITDSSGNYILDDVIQGQYSLIIREDGFAEQRKDITLFTSDSSKSPVLDNGTLTLSDVTFSVNGKVGYNDKTSKAGITVSLISSEGKMVQTVTSKEDGSFSFLEIEPGTYTVKAQTDDYSPVEKEIVGTCGNTYDIDLGSLVSNYGLIDGTIFDSCDCGLSGASIKLLADSSVEYSFVSDPNGKFNCSKVRVGEYTVSIEYGEISKILSTTYSVLSAQKLSINLVIEHQHTWNEGEITKDMTCTTDGLRTFTCTVCGQTKTEVIEATGHSYVNYKCSSCGLWGKGPSGGYVFYDCDADNNDENEGRGPDNLSSEHDGWRFLEAASTDLNKTYPSFGYYRTSDTGTNTTVGTETGIGKGKANTESLVKAMGETTYTSSSGTTKDIYAAKACADYSITVDGVVYDDWFLPSKDELNLMYYNLWGKDLGSFASNGGYWSSSEGSSDGAWRQYFGDGNHYDYNRGANFRVRPIRAFTECTGNVNHSWNSGVVTTQETCDVAGVITYTCEVCNQTKEESIPATGHSYSTEWSKDETNHWHSATCEHTTEKKDEANHIWDAGNVTTVATCAKDGVKTYTCTVCSQTKTENIPATETHTWNNGTITTSATCTADGVKTYICTVCGQTTTEAISATGHSYVNYKCSVCGIWGKGPAGGYVIYDCDADNDSGNADSLSSTECGWRYIERTPTPISSSCRFGLKEDGYSAQLIGATDIAIGAGRLNTEKLVASMGNEAWVSGTTYSADYAAKKAYDYSMTFGGKTFSDWYLPSYEELKLINLNNCWSSTEYSSVRAYYYKTGLTDERTTFKTVYGIRYFSEAEPYGHAYECSIVEEATCTTSGVKKYTCSVCGDSYTESYSITHSVVSNPGHVSYCSLCHEIYGSSGGYIFYDVDADNNSGNADGLISSECGWRYLEAAPYDLGMNYNSTPQYGIGGVYAVNVFCFGIYSEDNGNTKLFSNGTTTFDNSNCTKTAIGTGESNTDLLVSRMGTTDAYYYSEGSEKYIKTEAYAAKIVSDLSYNGYTDWFLPSKDELQALYDYSTTHSIGSLEKNGCYWSSSESTSNANAYYAHAIQMTSGTWAPYARRDDSEDMYIRPVRKVLNSEL